MMKLVVLSCVLAMASAGALISPFAYAAPYAYPASFAYAAPLLTPTNYRGPLSLAPGQPANILAADGRPLDTLEVNLDRAEHFTRKALEGAGLHVLKKRSAALFAPLPISRVAIPTAPLITSAPIAYSSPAFTTYTYSQSPLVHVLKKRSAPLIAPLPLPLNTVAAPIIPTSPLVYSAPALSAPYIPTLSYSQASYIPFLKK